jgi:heptosyltransferase-2
MRLAVFLPNWIGDAVMATPLLRALRRAYSGDRIVGVARAYVAGVLEGGDWFDELLIVQRGWLATAQAAQRLRKERLDLAVLLPNSFRSAATAWLAGARRIVGYARYGRSLLLSDAVPVPRDRSGKIAVQPVIDSYNRLADYLGCGPAGHQLHLFTTAADEAAAREVWERCQLVACSAVVCLNPGGAFGTSKHWPTEYFAELARELTRGGQCGVLVLCGPAERAVAAEIVRQAKKRGAGAVFDLGSLAEQGGPALGLGLTKATVRRCDLLITTDSGPRHFAHAFHRPVITLFGPTHIGWTETYHPLAIHLQRQVECGPCQQRVCPQGHHRCMRELLPGEVLRAAASLVPSLPIGSRKNAS